MSAQELQDRIDNEAARQLAPVMSFVDGKDADSIAGQRMESVSPIDGAVLTDFPDSDTADVDAAVTAARRAFVDRRWCGLGRRERKKVLLRFADLITQHQFELGVLQSRDMGMPVSMAINMDAGEAANTIRWYAEALDKLSDELLPLSERDTGLIAKVPVGVVGAIVPWNFPLMIAAWKLGPALASGNCVVLKPAEDASLALVRLAQLASEAGLPDGVLNVITGRGETAGRALALHRDVDALTFTGSGRVGGLVLQYAGQSNLKRVSLECGGKTANIVLADAPDLEDAAQNAARAIFRNQGQICNAPSRLLVEASIHDDFVERVVDIASTLRTGSPLKLDSDLGPVVNARQLSGIAAAIESASKEGAELRLDGRSADKPSQGCYLGPTIATKVDAASALAQEEIFGPVLAVIPIESLDHGIEIANGTRYGLGAAVWTRDIDKALHASERLHAGSVFVNAAGGVNVEMPFGGFKESGFGRDRSLHAFDKFTDTKATLIRRSSRNVGAAK